LATLNDTEIAILKILSSEGPKTLPEIKDRFHFSRNYPSFLLRRLYEEGYLDRKKVEKKTFSYSIKINSEGLTKKIEEERLLRKKIENAKTKIRIIACPYCGKYSQQHLRKGIRPVSVCHFCKAEPKKDGKGPEEYICEVQISSDVNPNFKFSQRRLKELFAQWQGSMLSHMPETIEKKTLTAQKIHYQILKTIKEYNLRNEPIGFTKLRDLNILCSNSLEKFIQNAKGWSMITSYPGEELAQGLRRVYRVTPIGDAFLTHYENTHNQYL
jgi:DNA-binding Lrp family transcriptional regulator